jgi:hypothetical protein
MATPQERARAMAVHSIADEIRLRGNADETDVVYDADGSLRAVPEHERGGHPDQHVGTPAR